MSQARLSASIECEKLNSEGMALNSSRGVPSAASVSKSADVPQWYALHTRARHEKKVAAALLERGIKAFVPVGREVHRWSDRSKVVESPLFPCYAFVHATITAEMQSAVSRHPSVFRWIGCQGQPSPIAEEEMGMIQNVLRSGLPVGPHAFVKVGERVRIRGGSLDGVEGVLIGHKEGRKLLVSVELVQQSVAISLSGYELELAA
jgi:transcription antitermination factor NusG